MSERRAKYVGHPDGVDLSIPFRDGDMVALHVPHGSELPAEVEGRKVPADYRDSLLEQADNWTSVDRAVGDEVKGKTNQKDDA
jgi:hypothetical protein